MNFMNNVLKVFIFKNVHSITIYDQLNYIWAKWFNMTMIRHVFLYLWFEVMWVQFTLIKPLFVYFAQKSFSTEVHLAFCICFTNCFEPILLLLFFLSCWPTTPYSDLLSYFHMIKNLQIWQGSNHKLIKPWLFSDWISIHLDLFQIWQALKKLDVLEPLYHVASEFKLF